MIIYVEETKMLPNWKKPHIEDDDKDLFFTVFMSCALFIMFAGTFRSKVVGVSGGVQ